MFLVSFQCFLSLMLQKKIIPVGIIGIIGMVSVSYTHLDVYKRQAGDSLKEVEKRLSDMAVLIKNVTTYQKTKPLYEAYKKARNREKYRAEHERGIILHEAAAKALKAAQIGGKLPSVPALQAEYEKLQEQKEALYADYGKLKKQIQEYDVIKRNIDSILQAEKQPVSYTHLDVYKRQMYGRIITSVIDQP